MATEISRDSFHTARGNSQFRGSSIDTEEIRPYRMSIASSSDSGEIEAQPHRRIVVLQVINATVTVALAALVAVGIFALITGALMFPPVAITVIAIGVLGAIATSTAAVLLQDTHKDLQQDPPGKKLEGRDSDFIFDESKDEPLRRPRTLLERVWDWIQDN